jgi:hypothetical protein
MDVEPTERLRTRAAKKHNLLLRGSYGDAGIGYSPPDIDVLSAPGSALSNRRCFRNFTYHGEHP